MTPTVTPRHRRGASLAIGGMFVVASTMLAGAPIASAAPSTEAVKAIDDHYPSVQDVLGQPTGEAVDVPGGVERDYEQGAIFYSEKTGPKAMYGEIFKKYQALGGPGGELGFPTNDESATEDGNGRFNEFTEKNGEKAAIYWGPNSGAWVIKGKVLDAWKASGGITGPFGYPKDDTMTSADGTIMSNFVGPDGTQISWSKAGVLATLPAALAGTIKLPGIEATTSVTKPTVTAPDKPKVEEKGFLKKFWWLLIPLLLLLLIPFLLKLFRKPAPEPVKVTTRAPEVKKVVTPPPAPPVKKVVAPPPPPRPAPKPPAPPAPKPVVKTPPPPAPKPVTPPPPPRPVVEPPKLVERVEQKVEHVVEKVERIVEAPKATIREAHIEHETSPVIRYETHTPAETSIEVTYENNAVDGQKSRADKSDLTPDYLQE